MSITGKSTLSIKKQDLLGQKLGATGFRKITFAHKASAGETGINLSSLTTPTELSSAGFTQPSPTLLAAANLKFFRSNLTLISSVRGVLQDYLSYTVNSSTQINFTESFGTTLDGEIFIGVIDAVPRNDLVGVDSTSILATGTLAAGAVQFNVGSAFKVNANPSTQIGEIAVYIDGMIQFRNSGNAAADPGADGNYQEIDNGSGYGTLIEVNDVDAINDRAVMVVGTGISIIRPNGSLVQELELLAGQIDAMVPTLAALAGVSESTFQSAPTNADLKAFGDRVLTAETDIDNIEVLTSVLQNPETMDDILATKLGFKTYTHGIAYNGGNTPNITCPQAGFAVVSSSLVPYQMQNGSWRLTFNVDASFTAATIASIIITMPASFSSGVQSGCGILYTNTLNSTLRGIYIQGTSVVLYANSTGTSAGLAVSGDVALASKPAWVY